MNSQIRISSPLNNYAVLSGANISNQGSTMIQNGNMGSILNTSVDGINFQGGSHDPNNVQIAFQQLRKVAQSVITLSGISSNPPTRIDNGVCYFYPGGYQTTKKITFGTDSMIVFDAQNNPNAQFYIRVGQVNFDKTQIQLSNGADYQNIFWLCDGELSISTKNIVLYGTFIVEGKITLSSGVTVIGHLFTLSGQIYLNNNTIIPQNYNKDYKLPCFVKGTKILTKDGYKKIESLVVGDLIKTYGDVYGSKIINREMKYRPVIWIGYITITKPRKVDLPIRIKPKAFGPGFPTEELMVSPDHNIFARGQLRPASQFIDGQNIIQESKDNAVTYYHVELSKHSVINANGLITESYVDVNNRYIFKSQQEKKNGGIINLS